LIDFGAGVTSFTIAGIDPAVDAENHAPFAIQLEFDELYASFTATPIVVPEPTADAAAAALVSCIALLVRRTRLAAAALETPWRNRPNSSILPSQNVPKGALMTRSKLVCLALALPCLLSFPKFAPAQECDYTWVLVNTDGSKPTADQHAEKQRLEQECKKRVADEKAGGAAARARLASEFDIDASKLSDAQAIARLQQEVDARQQAQEQAEARRAAIAEAQQASQQGKLMDSQAEMLKNLGVSLDDGDDQDADDGGVDPAELRMYQEMLKNGIAPQCKSKTGEALIDCVDAALDAE